jgi:hypothetical protein
MLVAPVMGESLLAAECLPNEALKTGLDELGQFLTDRPCSIKNTALLKNSDSVSSNVTLKRLSTKCSQSWTVQTKEGEIKAPAGLNVLVLPNNEIVFHLNGKIYQGVVKEEAFTGPQDCIEKRDIANMDAFYEEALFHLEQAKKLGTKDLPPFDQAIEEIKQKLIKHKNNKESFLQWQKTWNQKIERGELNKVDLIKKFQSDIQKIYNPQGPNNKKIMDATLIAPLSREWFESDPELQAFYKKTWIDSGYDIRINAGSSGEGVSYVPGRSEELNESFLQMKSLLEKTLYFLNHEAKNKNLKLSPEGQWLSSIGHRDLKKYDRMIFLSPATWNRNPKDHPWAEGVPVDQSLSGFESDYLLSVLIHEINVNSDGFLKNDTHGAKEETDMLRNCLSQNGISKLADDPITLERIFGYNSQLSVIYLKMILED